MTVTTADCLVPPSDKDTLARGEHTGMTRERRWHFGTGNVPGRPELAQVVIVMAPEPQLTKVPVSEKPESDAGQDNGLTAALRAV